jgi:hypothetical protein
MSRPEGEELPGGRPAHPPIRTRGRYGRYLGLLGVVVLLSVLVNAIVNRPTGASGLKPGTAMPPFAVPLALGGLAGDADVATHANDGEAGRVPACRERGSRILNICQLYEQGPVVLALFIDEGSCQAVLGQMQQLLAQFPSVRFAAVSIKGETAQLRRLINGERLSFPVGIDRDGAVAALYKVSACPQVNFSYAGGTIAQHALLGAPSTATLRSRLQALSAAAAARGKQG